jgi:hypothetical protein
MTIATFYTPEFHRVHSIQKQTCDKCKTYCFCHRHHLKHEMLFIRVFAFSHTSHLKWYKKLELRYYEFRPFDIRYLCPDCHKHIHHLYRRSVMRAFNRKNTSRRKDFHDFTTAQADELMKAFRKYYFRWRARK